ncbi:E3 ubiquitin-protein ligase [Tetrabaena socialis]|uniref:E3 ubiquitin-protein ligase n=1 Tax=Tetrabaena socialis TaxID=47790 RepID=A0A2J8AA20_9CHLO|nr:E3 ubiquitin-protein ligase [Tetrabaena socialis]|eukprot:PNH09376.1 E3 ubiquitin-protein ligase [Tetrabaena socialis]
MTDHIPNFPAPAAQKVLDALPCSTYQCSDSASEGACAICQCDYARGDQLLSLPCFHMLHSACARQWLGSYSNKCPVCKHEVS